MVAIDEVRVRLEGAFSDAEVTVADTTGEGDHFEVRVRTAEFAGKSLVDQHRMVYDALGELMSSIHALSLRTEPAQ
jgi:stress-induced morphogen